MKKILSIATFLLASGLACAQAGGVNCEMNIPSVVRGNGDTVNDCWRPTSNCPIDTYKCTVYNRWGNQMLDTDDPDFCWDGTNKNGDALPEGTYFYVMDVRFVGFKESQVFNGHVSIHR